MSKQDIIRTFDRYAEDYDQVVHGYYSERRGDCLASLAKGHVLEVGAGSGVVTSKLMRKGKVTAVDISPKMVDVLIRKLGVEAFTADAERLPFKDGKFDSVISSELIYYLNEPQNFFNESYRVLKKGGVCAVSCLNNSWIIIDKLRYVPMKLGLKLGSYDSCYSSTFYRKELLSMMKKAGYENIVAKCIVIFPFKSLHKINMVLEKTFFKSLGLGIVIWGRK